MQTAGTWNNMKELQAGKQRFSGQAVKLVQENTKSRPMAKDINPMETVQKGRFFQAWGELGAKDNYNLIIVF